MRAQNVGIFKKDIVSLEENGIVVAISIVVSSHHSSEGNKLRVVSPDNGSVGPCVIWIVAVTHDEIIKVPVGSIDEPEHMARHSVALQDRAAGIFRSHANAIGRGTID